MAFMHIYIYIHFPILLAGTLLANGSIGHVGADHKTTGA